MIILLFITSLVNAQFTPGNIVVSRVGDGVTTLSNASFQVQLVEYTTAGVPTGVVVTLPTTSGGAGNRACTNSGTATTEGFLTQSYDGRFLVHVGYDAPQGTGGIATSTVNRTIARIDAGGIANTSTSFLATAGNAYSGLSIRAACTYDGSQFWASGGSGATAGVRYLAFGNDNIAGTQISITSTNTRGIKIFDDQLYISTAAGTTLRIASVGTGMPTTSGQTITNLPPNIPTSNFDPANFIFFDKNAAVAGPDLLYVACQSTTVANSGLYKYSFDGTTWTAQGFIQTNAQVVGVTGYTDCSGNIVLYLTRSGGGAVLSTQILQYIDNSSYNAPMTNNGGDFLTASTLLVTAAANYGFRGLAMSPAQGYTVTGAQNIAAGSYNKITVKSGGTATLTGNIVVYDKIVVESGGTLVMGSNIITSPAGIGSSFEVKSGGTIKIGSADGITASAALGNVQTCFRTYASGANYEYNGTVPQVTGNGLPISLSGTLRINNSSGIATTGVTLTQNTSVAGTLDLSLGKFTTSFFTQVIRLENGSNVINAGTSSFVSGPIKKIGDTDFTFPVGKGSIYAPLSLTGGAGAVPADDFTVEYMRVNPQSLYGNTYAPGINHVSYVEHWTISRLNGNASKIVSLDVHQTSFCLLPVTTFVSKNDGGIWTNEPSIQTGFAACGIYQCGTISTSSPVTSFSPFTLATSDPFAINPLPIKLISFNATKISSSRSLISWELAACCSKEAWFELEKSTDGRNYTLLTTLAGSESSKLYSYTDNQLTAGTTWYRLKATDADGKITYSRVATIVNDDSGGLVVTLSPNPAGEQAVVSVTAAKKATVQFSIISSSGVVMKQWQQTVAAGTQTAAADMSALPAGIYQLLCQSEAEKVVVRFVKN